MNADEDLVYLDDTTSLAPFDGYVYVARIVGGDEEDIQVQLLTNTLGYDVNTPHLVHVAPDRLLSTRTPRDIYLPYFYYFSDDEGVLATNLVDKTQLTQPLTQTSRSALGSGVYGLYLTSPQEIEEFKTNPDQVVYEVACISPLFIQDKEHGVSLSFASYSTNVFLEQKMLGFTPDRYQLEGIDLQPEEVTHLVRLWNFVFWRASATLINEEWLVVVLSNYLDRYFSEDEWFDSVTNVPLAVLPVNDILGTLGYQEILASDVYNNGWDRGCVSLRSELWTMMRASRARY